MTHPGLENPSQQSPQTSESAEFCGVEHTPDALFMQCSAGGQGAETVTPYRVQLRRTKGWRMPENTVKVSRPGRWGNPFAPPYVYPQLAVALFRDMMTWGFDPGKLAHLSDRDFEAVCIAKDVWSKRLNYGVEHERAAISELRGKNLACWCPLDAPCHADVLLELANPHLNHTKGTA